MATKTMSPMMTFPVDWDVPFDDGAAFYPDPMHYPHPLTPLTASTLSSAIAIGMMRAARELQSPLQDWQVRFRNYYWFDRSTMAQPATEEEAKRMADVAEANGRIEIGRLLDRWYGEHLPRISAHLERLRSLHVLEATGTELVAMLDEVTTILEDLWTIHFRIIDPMMLAMQLFDELYVDLFGGTEADAHALLVGAVTESVKAGFGLSDLAATARELGLGSIIQETPSHELVSSLQGSEVGRAFLAKLDAYLEVYGLRQDLFEYATPTWQEDPSFPLSGIRSYIVIERDARGEHAAMARAAEAALEAARARLTMYPEAVRNEFEAMVRFARHATFLQEEHNFYIDQRGLSLLRLFYLRLGQRLAADDVLAEPQDVFMLTGDELQSIAGNLGDAWTADRVRELVQERRGEMEIARHLTPPRFIGVPPADPAPNANPMERAVARFIGAPPQAADMPGQLKGNAGSRGVATGIARVVRTLEEATGMLPGEILVAVTTMPAWTPLFGIAAAVVTETGGPLSHCAIVAREYGIPAVVGAHDATRAIVTGQRITVDGSCGIVTLDT